MRRAREDRERIDAEDILTREGSAMAGECGKIIAECVAFLYNFDVAKEIAVYMYEWAYMRVRTRV